MSCFDTIDPLKLKSILWPDVTFYREQKIAIYSAFDNDETYIPAGNKLGKDFLAGFVCLAFFLTRKPCRIITTSAKDDHLRVLWGEINRFISNAKYPLEIQRGGPLIVNHQDIRRMVDGDLDRISYLKGMVASPDREAAMQGHHANPDNLEEANDGIPRTMFVADECSSVPNNYLPLAKTWASRILCIGNTWDCDNFWIKNIEAGDLVDPNSDPTNPRYWRRVIHIQASDSPNVRYGLAEERAGLKPSNTIIVPGVKSYAEYQKHRATLNEIEQSVVLDAKFYKGKELFLYPSDWLLRANRLALFHKGKNRRAKGGGCDPAEGGDKTSMCCVDEYGIIDLVSMKTPDTSDITGQAIAFIKKHNIPPEKFCFDRGGGGKQHADRLRKLGYPVRTVGFGEALSLDPVRRLRIIEEKMDHKEEHYEYEKRRSQMYGELREILDPSITTYIPGTTIPISFGIDPKYDNLYNELSPIPLTYDEEGRFMLIPKHKKPGQEQSKRKTLLELIGHSPDEADALVLAIHGMLHQAKVTTAGAM